MSLLEAELPPRNLTFKLAQKWWSDQLQSTTQWWQNVMPARLRRVTTQWWQNAMPAITERDARFTEDQIHALSADYTIGLNEAGNVQMKFNLFESADLNTFAPLTVNPESVSVVDGSICLEFAPAGDAAFYRFRVE